MNEHIKFLFNIFFNPDFCSELYKKFLDNISQLFF